MIDQPHRTRLPGPIPAARALLLCLALAFSALLQAQAPGDDAPIRERIEAIYASVDGLAPVEVRVEAGVVTLQGEVVSDQLRLQAQALAEGVGGVVTVQNQVVVSADVSKRIVPALERFEERTMRVVNNLPLFLVGLVVLLLAWWFSGWLSRRPWILGRVPGNAFMRNIARQLIRATIMVAAVLFVLDLLELTALVGAVLGAAGVATLAVGFAFRDLIENYVSSVLLSIRQPFEPNDLIRIGEHTGRVSRLTSRATVLITLDGNHVRIPNATVFKSEMTNFTRNPRRRFDFELGVDVDLELLPVQSLAEQVLGEVDGVMSDPGPVCLVTQLGDSSVILQVFGWVDQTVHDFGRVRSEAIRQVKEAFDEAGIVMPEPIYTVKMQERTAPTTPPRASGAEKARPRSDRPEGADTRRQDPTEAEVSKEMGEGQNLLDEKARRE
jgi:small-conductance mechanosensitive channel